MPSGLPAERFPRIRPTGSPSIHPGSLGPRIHPGSLGPRIHPGSLGPRIHRDPWSQMDPKSKLWVPCAGSPTGGIHSQNPNSENSSFLWPVRAAADVFFRPKNTFLDFGRCPKAGIRGIFQYSHGISHGISHGNWPHAGGTGRPYAGEPLGRRT